MAVALSCIDCDVLRFDAEFLRRDLQQRSLDALAELGLTGEDADAIGVDANPGIEHGRGAKTARQSRRCRLGRRAGKRRASQRETYHQGRAGPEQRSS
jgi:hypothetical protein